MDHNKLVIKLLKMMFDQKIINGRMVYVYNKAQRDVMSTVIDMFSTVVVDGVVSRPVSDEDVSVAMDLLKDAGVEF